MASNEQLIHQFYTSFQTKDYKTMQQCYADEIIFSDDAFQTLKNGEAKAMWHMLLSTPGDLQLTYEDVKADEIFGSCTWTAVYTFSLTHQKVTNRIQAKFEFENGKIITHADTFSFWKWARQAFGVTGLVLGWTPFFKNKVQATAQQRLKNFIEKHPEYKS